MRTVEYRMFVAQCNKMGSEIQSFFVVGIVNQGLQNVQVFISQRRRTSPRGVVGNKSVILQGVR